MSSVLLTALEGNGATEEVVGGVVRVFYSRHLERMGSLGGGVVWVSRCCTHGT